MTDLPVSFPEYRDIIYESYRYFRKMFGSDEEGFAQACEPIIAFCNETAGQDDFDGSTKAVVVHMQSAKDQFTNLV